MMIGIVLLHNRQSSGLFSYANIFKSNVASSELIVFQEQFKVGSNMNQWYFTIYCILFLQRINKFIDEKWSKYDAIHICDNPVYSYFILSVLSRNNIKVIYTIHDVKQHVTSGFWNKLKSSVVGYIQTFSLKFINNLNNVIVHYHEDVENCVKRKIVFPHPEYPKLVRKTNLKKELFTLGFFGRLEYYKGIDIFLESLRILDKSYTGKPLEVIIAGSSKTPLLFSLENIELCLENNFLDEITFDSLISRTDLMVLPYREVTTSGVLMKSITYNVPALVSNCKEFLCYSVSNSNIMVVESLDPLIWAKRITDYVGFYNSDSNILKNNLKDELLSGDDQCNEFYNTAIECLQNL